MEEDENAVLAIYVTKDNFQLVSKQIKNDLKDRVEITGLSLIKKAKDLVALDNEEFEKLEQFIEGIDELNDVNKIWHNGKKIILESYQ
ncbi:MAG: hypothetical protein Q9M91_07965 [Candidatus Dojkabacteria bacterium]|nr:hypothetical protein [Candidatus Dojkabacteria bacterium]